jgi:hypothetical protein
LQMKSAGKPAQIAIQFIARVIVPELAPPHS